MPPSRSNGKRHLNLPRNNNSGNSGNNMVRINPMPGNNLRGNLRKNLKNQYEQYERTRKHKRSSF